MNIYIFRVKAWQLANGIDVADSVQLYWCVALILTARIVFAVAEAMCTVRSRMIHGSIWCPHIRSYTGSLLNGHSQSTWMHAYAFCTCTRNTFKNAVSTKYYKEVIWASQFVHCAVCILECVYRITIAKRNPCWQPKRKISISSRCMPPTLNFSRKHNFNKAHSIFACLILQYDVTRWWK